MDGKRDRFNLVQASNVHRRRPVALKRRFDRSPWSAAQQ
jgi:hypothetical protein